MTHFFNKITLTQNWLKLTIKSATSIPSKVDYNCCSRSPIRDVTASVVGVDDFKSVTWRGRRVKMCPKLCDVINEWPHTCQRRGPHGNRPSWGCCPGRGERSSTFDESIPGSSRQNLPELPIRTRESEEKWTVPDKWTSLDLSKILVCRSWPTCTMVKIPLMGGRVMKPGRDGVTVNRDYVGIAGTLIGVWVGVRPGSRICK